MAPVSPAINVKSWAVILVGFDNTRLSVMVVLTASLWWVVPSAVYKALTSTSKTKVVFPGTAKANTGSGDAYVAGALYGLLKHGDIDSAVKYGNAMAALKNTTANHQAASQMSLLMTDELRLVS